MPLFALFLLASLPSSGQRTALAAANLRCEYRNNPMGIDTPAPRFSWEPYAITPNRRQTAFRLLVATDSLALVAHKADVWDSGKIMSGQTNQVTYRGPELNSGRKYYWKVQLWDEAGKSEGWSRVASWSMGLLHKQDWKAQWIGAEKEQIPLEKRYYANYGYQCDFSTQPDAAKWVAVDLGKPEEMTEIRLYPTNYKKNENGYLFPLRFRVELADDSEFRNPVVVADESKADYIKQGLEPYVCKFGPQKARYIRIWVNRMATPDSARYAFTLAELEAIGPGGKNLAFSKKVTASDSYIIHHVFSYENWLPLKLTDGYTAPNATHKPYSIPIPPSPLLRKTFAVKKKVKRATLYATALGLYEVRINGQKVGDQLLAPEWTDYHKRVQYQTFDVTRLLRQGDNVIGAMLADGWYAGAIFAHPERGAYGFDRRFLGQMELQFDDGSKAIIASDGSWKLHAEGPVREASIFNGETYDAAVNPSGWDAPGFDDSRWKPVTVDKNITLVRSAQMNEPIRKVGMLEPVSIVPQGENTYIVDMGQNFAGWVKLKLPYNPGKPVVLRHGEVLDEEGKLYTANLRAAKQVVTYIPGKEKSVDFEPRFTYQGFRYVEISGLTRPPQKEHIQGIVVASAAPQAGTFETSSKDLNKLWENILWTQRGNMHSTPTDCPQRDERAGWMGDAQVFSQTAIFNLDMASFFTKWIRDIRDSQTPEGRFPDYAPHVGIWNNFYNSPGWGDAGVITPWRMYENYGDTTVLGQHFEAMKAFIQSILIHNPDLLWKKARGNMYGDWLNGNTIVADDYPKDGGKVPDDVYASAFFAYSSGIVARVAKLLNREKDVAYYDSLASAIRNAFVKAYISGDGKVYGDTQAGYALALEFDLVPHPLRAAAARHMVAAVEAYDFRISTGIQTTIRLMNQLTACGYSDVAYRLLESHRFPSWLYSVDQGATTIWERWDGYVKGRGFRAPNMNSFNHYAIGAVGEWLYKSILGINIAEPGYRHFVIHPRPGGSLDWARGTYHAITGKIRVSWKKTPESFSLDVEIPVNTTAVVVVPQGKNISLNGQSPETAPGVEKLAGDGNEARFKLPSGSYRFETAW